MNKLTKLLSTLLIASLSAMNVAFADEEKNISVFINKANDENAKVDIKVNGSTSSFELPELADGESKTITTDSGRSFTVSKNNGQFKILTDDGEEIIIPSVDDHQLTARVKALHTIDGKTSDDSIKIIANELTESQRQIIKESLLAAGVDKKVKFIENSPVALFLTGDANAMYEFESDIEEIHIKDGQHIKVDSKDNKKKKHIIIKKKHH